MPAIKLQIAFLRSQEDYEAVDHRNCAIQDISRKEAATGPVLGM